MGRDILSVLLLPLVLQIFTATSFEVEAVIYRSIVLGGRFEAGCTSGLNVWYLNTLPIDLQTCGCNATTESLVIDPVLESSTGEYNCAFGEIWKLWVIVPPSVRISGSTEYIAGQTLSLFYNLEEGSNITSVRWFQDDSELVSEGRIRISGKNLTKSILNSMDIGMYSVTVTNDAGEDTNAVKIIIQFQPDVSVVATPSSLVTLTQNVTLQCTIRANPGATLVSWTRRTSEGVEEPVSLHRETKATDEFSVTTTISTLEVSLNEIDSQYSYTCSAENVLGNSQNSITVQKGGPPPPPEGVKVSSTTPTTITLQWNKPSLHTFVDEFKVEWRLPIRMWSSKVVDRTSISATIDGLTPNTRYEVRVASVNTEAVSTSQILNAITLHEPPSSPPTSVSAKWIQEQERVQLKWNAVQSSVDGSVQGYLVQTSNLNHTTTETMILLTLQRGTLQTLRVLAFNSGGNGPSEEIQYLVPPVRSPVEDFTLMKLSSSSFGVTWSPPADVADLAGYNVTILGTAPNDYWETSIDSSVNSACFDVPTFSSDYRVSLRSIYTDNSYVSTDKEIISLKKVDNSVENKENCIKVTFLESDTTPSPTEEGLSVPIIVAVIVVIALLVVLSGVVGAIFVFWRCRRQKNQHDLESNSSTSNKPIGVAFRLTPSPPSNDDEFGKNNNAYHHSPQNSQDLIEVKYYDVEGMYPNSPTSKSFNSSVNSQIIGIHV